MLVSRVGAALAAVLSVALAGQAAAQSATPASVGLAERMHGHVAFLADDALEGREAGERGYDLAAVYVGSQFQSLGLRPANDRGWNQPATLIERALVAPATASWTDPAGASNDWTADGGLLLSPGVHEGVISVNAPLVFVGHGVSAPEHGVDDYAGIDTTGKIVVMLRGVPAGMPSELGAHLSTQKGAMAQAHGAVGMIQLLSKADAERYPWSFVQGLFTGPALSAAGPDGLPISTSPDLAFSGYANHVTIAPAFANAPMTLDVVLDAAAAGTRLSAFDLAGTVSVQAESRLSTITSPNVVGVLPGTDPTLADQPVMVTAHLDHEGVDPDESKEDRIYNGAMDNASGIAAMIEAARILAADPPRRPVMFIALTAEEKGLLGAAYMAGSPLTPMNQVAGLVNLDMPILTYDFQDVVAFGAEESTLGELTRAAAAAEGVALSPDPAPEETIFVRSDHYEFVKVGVPSIYLVTGGAGPGAAAVQDFQANHYHQVSDDLNLPIDWNAAAKFARLNAAIIRAIGDAETRPMWYEGSFFGNTFAPDAEKAPDPAE